MKKILGVLAIFALIVVLTSCSQQASRVPEGVWQLQSSDIDFGYVGVGTLDYLSFDQGKPTAQLFGHDDRAGLKGYASVFVNTTNGLLIIWPDSGMGGCGAGAVVPQELSYAYRYETSGNTLTLTDSQGRIATFDKAAEVPAAARIELLEPTLSVPLNLPVDVAYASNLLSDGTRLWVVGEDRRAYPIDPETGSVGAGQTLTAHSSYFHAVTMQDGDFWSHCQCGGSHKIKRLRLGGTEIDEVDTDADLGHEISIRAGSWDGHRLWLLGFNHDRDRSELLRVDTDAEPDSLESVFVFDTGMLRRLTYHEGALWGLFRFAGWQVAELDPAAGRVSQNYTLPVLGIEDRYLGIASLGGKLYLLSEEGDGYKLIAVQP
ncbi:MAG TPA: hypothetical protein ENK37_07385 [Oceanithermus profundus]|uniref:Lipoprotein n=1 Tax=Oceanithermus profundus TaxID=187137 RepID=A0A7C4ZH99_9DEIN|nr:hypothetical protein [Oceanithermus profundus]